MLVPLFLVAGCTGDGGENPFTGAPSQPFVGGVIGDEPRAVTVGQDILREGGSAADAVVATYFALAVTYPNAAALGGGGACVAYDAIGKRMESLTFLPVAPAGGGPVAVPGNLRGMVALHARHGRKRWSAVVSPAENLARFGFPMSRALARVVHAQGPGLMADPGIARLVVDANGRPLEEGDTVVQPELAEFLSEVRTNPFGLTSTMIAELADGARQAGASLTIEDLKQNGAEWRLARVIPWSELSIGMPDTEAGRRVQRLWEDLDDGDTYTKAAGAGRAAVLAAAMKKVYGDGGVGDDRPEHASTGLVAVDKDGSGVACTVTMGRPFGARVSAAESGIIFAAAPPQGGGYEEDIVPMVGVNRPFLAINKNFDTLYFLSAGTAEAATGPNQLATAVPLFEDGITLDQALALPRIRRNGSAVEYEDGLPGPAIAAMRDRALSPHAVDSIGRIHAVYCPGGFSAGDSASCRFRVDRRSYGLVARGE